MSTVRKVAIGVAVGHLSVSALVLFTTQDPVTRIAAAGIFGTHFLAFLFLASK